MAFTQRWSVGGMSHSRQTNDPLSLLLSPHLEFAVQSEATVPSLECSAGKIFGRVQLTCRPKPLTIRHVTTKVDAAIGCCPITGAEETEIEAVGRVVANAIKT